MPEKNRHEVFSPGNGSRNRVGSLFNKADGSLYEKADGSWSVKAEGSLSKKAEGSLSKKAEGSLSKKAEGSSKTNVKGSDNNAKSTIHKLAALKTSAEAILKHELGSLQVIPPVAVKLLKLTNDDASSFTDLALIIETEPSLSLEVLRLVNSAYYNFSRKISTIKRAVTVLGFSAIRQIALNLLFFKKMIKPDEQRKFNPIFYWQHCLFVATLSKTIAANINHPDPDAVYAAGLLHDIGKIVLESYGQITYSDFLCAHEDSDNASVASERNFFGISHAEIGAVYCHQCDLPESIIDVVLHHHSLAESNLGNSSKLNSAIVSYANFIAWLQGVGSVPSNHCPALEPEIFAIINAYHLDMEIILEQVDQEINTISAFYNFRFPNLNELRANLIETIFKLNFSTDRGVQVTCNEPSNTIRHNSVSSMTMPHHSLDPDEFIPWTLEALQKEFAFERLLVLNINPKRRSLVAQYCWPSKILAHQDEGFEIMIPSMSGQFLQSLRKKQPALVDDSIFTDRYILQQLRVKAFLCVPILICKRLSGVLYIDNFRSGKTLQQDALPKLNRVVKELGIALVNASQFNQEKKKSELDPLTGVNNRGMVDQFIALRFAEQQSRSRELAVGFIDIDHFKQFNDLYGHQSGDEVLKIVAHILQSLTRPNDFIGRYGGEEFVFVMVDTNSNGVKGFAERIRKEVECKGRNLGGRFPAQSLTVSIGVVMYQPKYTDYQQLINTADKAMYQSKQDGRNKVTIIL